MKSGQNIGNNYFQILYNMRHKIVITEKREAGDINLAIITAFCLEVISCLGAGSENSELSNLSELRRKIKIPES